jgi:lambda family phage minor tail protein L
MTSISTAPPTHLVDAQKLEADGYVDLWEIMLIGGSVIRLKANDPVTYRSNVYEAFAIQISGESQNSDTEVSRPKLNIINPDGAFSPAIHRGDLNRATVVRKRVLRTDLLANTNVFQQNSWTISRVVSLNKHAASFEMRGVGDMQRFVVPIRMFVPPDFPLVSLT